jgi:toxin YoeB
MSYTLVFSKTALADINKHKKSGDKPTLKKLEKLLHELMEHPATGTGQPEVLKHDLTGLYSRRINRQSRLVYAINEEMNTVNVLSAWAHYGDK